MTIWERDGDNNKTSYAYDARKRLQETDYPDGTKKTYAYDGPGNLTLVTDQAGNQVEYSYDAANQLANVVQLNSPNTGKNTTVYGYDGDGDPIAFKDANTHTTQQSFNVLNELTGTTLPDGTLNESRTYDLNGNLQTLTNFMGEKTTFAYDTLNRLLSRTPDPSTGEPTVSFTYTATGKRATMTDASGQTTYSYDNMDRLLSKVTPEGTLSYTYDGGWPTHVFGDVSVVTTWGAPSTRPVLRRGWAGPRPGCVGKYKIPYKCPRVWSVIGRAESSTFSPSVLTEGLRCWTAVRHTGYLKRKRHLQAALTG